jgi:aryl-alcohol dehydrogenase-like predicted oxidoreductase
MFQYVDAGLTTFDLADHYGPAEDLIGIFRQRWKEQRKTDFPIQAFTKWVPRAGPMTKSVVEAAINRSLKRMNATCLDMLQFHWWDYEDDRYMEALKQMQSLQKEGKIKHLALTNFDTTRLKQIVEAGIPIVSNQVQFSLIDRRPLNKMAEVCTKHNVKLLAYGTVLGGLLSEKWLGKPEPTNRTELNTASLGKYMGTLRQWGNWKLFQEMLAVLDGIAKEHKVDIAAVGMRWVLNQTAVGGVILGTRLSVAQHISNTMKVFSLKLTDKNVAAIDDVWKKGQPLDGDCGDEYR